MRSASRVSAWTRRCSRMPVASTPQTWGRHRREPARRLERRTSLTFSFGTMSPVPTTSSSTRSADALAPFSEHVRHALAQPAPLRPTHRPAHKSLGNSLTQTAAGRGARPGRAAREPARRRLDEQGQVRCSWSASRTISSSARKTRSLNDPASHSSATRLRRACSSRVRGSTGTPIRVVYPTISSSTGCDATPSADRAAPLPLPPLRTSRRQRSARFPRRSARAQDGRGPA